MQKYLSEKGLYPENLLGLSNASILQRLLVVCLSYAFIVAAIWPSEYLTLLELYVKNQFILMSKLLFIGLPVFAIVLNPRAPLTYIRLLIRKRGLAMLTIALVFVLSIAAFSTYKHAISYIVGFYAEFPIADLDKFIHGGQPWQVLHNWTPEWAYPYLALCYGALWGGEWLGCILISIFLFNNRQRVRFFLSYVAAFIILGTILRTVGASAGPIFYDRLYGGERFSDMMAALQNVNAAKGTMSVADYLYAGYLRDDAVFGAGISAMPSMHVALATLNAFFLSQFNRWIGLIAWTYALLIMYGSVFFGWHYALDGYVSILVVTIIWIIAGRITAKVPTDS